MRYGSRLLSHCSSALRGPACTGFLMGVLGWAWFSQFLMAWGTGFQATAAMGVAVCIAAATTLVRRPGLSPAWTWLALAGWTVVTPNLLAFTTSIGTSLLDEPKRAFFAALSSALICLSPGLALILRAAPADPQSTRRDLRRWTLSAGAAWCLAPLTIGAWPGAYASAVAVAGLMLVRFVQQLQATETEPAAVIDGHRALDLSSTLATGIGAAVAGVAAVLVTWFQTQLFLPTAALWCAAWGGLVIGASVGLKTSTGTTLSRTARCCAGLGLLVAFLAITFPWMLQLAMTISGGVSWLPAIVGLRTAIVAGMMFLPGIAFGMAAAGRNPQGTSGLFLATLCFLVGFLGAHLSNLTLLAALPFTLIACGLGVALWLVSMNSAAPAGRWSGMTPVGAVTAMALAALASPSAHLPGQRMLFSGPHFQARALGVSDELLHSIDDGRLIRSTVTSHGTTAVWRHAGVQSVLRRNGVTLGVVSTQSDVCPQPVSEVLTACLPLTIHPQPHHILVTSASYPTVAGVCLLFPVETVTAFDADPAALPFCRESAERVCPSLARGDNRLSLHQADPVRGLASTNAQYDVVIAPYSVMGDIDSARQGTAEHLRSIHARLASGGVFCQRITCFDLNVPTVLDFVRTAQSIFPSVQLNEVAPGEWLLIARMETDSTLDKSFLERLEKPHVRDVLASAGWDWSIVLSLKTVHPTDLSTLASNSRIVSARDAQIAYSLPLDVMRWGPKFELRRQWISRHARPLGDALGDEPALTDVTQRLSDVKLAQQVMIDHPDQFAAYRHFVKKRLQDRPRPKVIQVAGEGLKNGLDPEDSRRKVYLTALGKAAETKSRRDIDRLAEFYAPFDPLLTPFIPREFVRIDRQAGSPDFTAQWRWGLRSVYYAPPNDASVNNVCDALDVLKQHPEVVGDAAAQWDCCNALLDVLKNRWGLRITSGATLKYGVADAHRTLELASALLEHMDSLHTSAGVSDEDWQTRRLVIEKHLIRPVRSWRIEQSAKLALQSATETQPAANSDTEPSP
ncbi:MAG TPA: hypothetical protein VM510_03275 [Caulifigura sp.]|nr:hypothetical protein [Caulifigura sp.]